MEKKKLLVEDMLKIKVAGEVALSPEGDLAVYVMTSIDKKNNKYCHVLYGAEVGKEPFPLTNGPSDTKPKFSPDGKELAFLSNRSGSSQIWILPVSLGEAKQYTQIKGGVSDFIWLPEGNGFVYLASLNEQGLQKEKDPDPETNLYDKHTKEVRVIENLYYKMDGMGYLSQNRPQLVYQEREQKPVQLTQGPQFVYRLCDVDETGRKILFTSRQDDDWDRNAWSSYLYEYDMEKARVKSMITKDLDVQQAAYSPKGDRIALLATLSDLTGGNTKLYTMPIEGGEPELALPNLDKTLGNLALSDLPLRSSTPIVWGWGAKSVYLPLSEGGKVSLVKIFVDTEKIETIVEGNRVVYSYSLSANCKKIAFAASYMTNPSDLFYLDTENDNPRTRERQLTELNPWLEEYFLSTPEILKARASRKSPEVDLWVMRPKGFKAHESYPAILQIHGGPMLMYGYSFFFEFQLMANMGMGVIFSNPRGSQGYGEEFCTAIAKEWGKLDYNDLLAVRKRALRRHKWIDDNRISVAGGSYGGFMTAWIIGHTDIFKAAICSRPVIHWTSMSGTSDGNWSWYRRFDFILPWEDEKAYRQQSPFTYVDKVKTPVLIEIQEGDLRCPIEQGQMYFSALKYLNKAPVKLVSYPNEFHGMSRNGKPWNKVHRLDQIVDWLVTYGID